MKKLSATQVNAWRLSPDRTGCRSLLALVSALAMLAWTFSAHAQVLATAQLNIERRGHTATLLDDGKVLIVGGDNHSGMISQSELFDPASQSVSLSAASIAARTDHTATKLLDGRVIIVGGQGQNGSLTSTEIYNPLTSSFTAGPSLTTPRSGHTATVLADGKILVAGGDSSGSAEIYDPLTQNFSLLTGSMQTARKFHSAILTSSGQVLIVGGVDAQNSILNTAEVYDPSSQSFYTPPTDMQTQRALATLKLLPDGKVQIIGGDAELSMEVFDPSDGIFIAKALLPPNTDLLGATLSTQSRAALFSPSISQDPLLQGVLNSEQIALLDRSDHSITELPSRNQALVAGGINSGGQILNSAKLVNSSKASVTTDKTDYAPGQIVTITGSGFQPNETVNIYFHEFPEAYPDVFFSATANQQGNFVTAEFAPKEIDLGRIFSLTAIGQSSGFTAQTAFKDAIGTITTIASDMNPSAVGQSVMFTATVRETGSGGGTAGKVVTIGSVTFQEGGNNCNQGVAFASNVILNAAGQATASKIFSTNGNRTIRACYTGAGSGGGATSNSDISLVQAVNTAAATTTAINAPSITYGANASVTVTVSTTAGTPTGNVTLAVDGGAPVSKPLSAGSATFTSIEIAALASPNAGDHSLSANYSAQGNFAASSATGNLHVNKGSPVITFGAAPTPTFGGGNFTVSASTTNTDSSTLTYGEVSGPCAVVNANTGIFSSSGAGTCVVRASGTATTNFLAASADLSVTIHKAPVTATAGGGTTTYDGTTKTPSACVVTGVYKGDLTCANNPASVGPGFGTTTIVPVVSGTGLDNFEVTAVNGLYTINPLGFDGFLSPIGGADVMGGDFAHPIRTIKLGSTLPVKFIAYGGAGTPWLTGVHTIQAFKYSSDTSSLGDPVVVSAADSATTGNQFRLTDGQWHFNMSTKAGFSQGIWKIVATLEDGSTHYAWIALKK